MGTSRERTREHNTTTVVTRKVKVTGGDFRGSGHPSFHPTFVRKGVANPCWLRYAVNPTPINSMGPWNSIEQILCRAARPQSRRELWHKVTVPIS